MSDDLIASACQELGRRDAVMTEETVNAVGILISRAVVMKRQRAAAITSEEKRRGKTRWSPADNDAIV